MAPGAGFHAFRMPCPGSRLAWMRPAPGLYHACTSHVPGLHLPISSQSPGLYLPLEKAAIPGKIPFPRGRIPAKTGFSIPHPPFAVFVGCGVAAACWCRVAKTLPQSRASVPPAPGVWTFWISQPEGLPEGSRRSPGVVGGAGRPPGNGAGDVLHSGRSARLVTAEPVRDWHCPGQLGLHPSAMGSTYLPRYLL
jgi:hypothetical protein